MFVFLTVCIATVSNGQGYVLPNGPHIELLRSGQESISKRHGMARVEDPSALPHSAIRVRTEVVSQDSLEGTVASRESP